MPPDVDDQRALTLREFLWDMAFFLLPPLATIMFLGSLPGELSTPLALMLGGPVFVVAVLLSPIGVILGETISPNHSNFARAVSFIISGLVFCFGFGATVLFEPVVAVIYAILGPILVPVVVSKVKKLV